MKKANYSIHIKAPREKVWKILWDDATYRQWTSVFSEGSYAVSDWNEGSEILFLGNDGKGMFSTIAKKTPDEYMSFEHQGIYENEEKQPENDETKEWKGAMENYTLKEANGGTQLSVDMDVADAHEEYFSNTFPKALEAVKKIAEMP